MSETKPAAFVTYGWCRTSYNVVKSLGEKGIDVHVGDSSKLAMSRFSRYCKSFSVLPDLFEEPDKYYTAVCEAMQKVGATVLLPAHEDVQIFSERKKELPDWIKIAVPDYEMWNIGEDKYDYAEHVRNGGCPSPVTYKVSSEGELNQLAENLDFPVIIKARIGNSAKGVAIVKCKESLVNSMMEIVNEYNLSDDRWPVVQEMLPGKKVGVLGVYNNGKHASSVVFDIVRSKGCSNFGTSTYRVSIDAPDIKESAKNAAESLNWNGVVDMDFVLGSDGVAYLIDLNGRLGGATALTKFAGVDLPYIWYSIAAGLYDGKESIPKIGVHTRWILGDTLGALSSLKNGKLKEFFQTITPLPGCHHDDFNMSDPLPFMFEYMSYFYKFLKAKGNANPVTKGMIR